MADNDIFSWSNEEIINEATELGIVDGSRIVGFYFETSVDLLRAGVLPVSGGGEYATFLGVDLQTGERVVAHYGGGIGSDVICNSSSIGSACMAFQNL